MKQTTPWRVALDDAALGHAEKPDVQIVQPLALRFGSAFGGAVGVGQIALFGDADSGEAVVRRIAQHHQQRRALLDRLGLVAFLFHFREQQVLLRPLGRLPIGQGVGQKDAGAFVLALIERYALGLQE